MQRRLRALSRRLVEIQENERRAIARELHDEIGQLLTGLKLLLDMAYRKASPEVQKLLVEAGQVVEETLHRVRELSLNLRPSALDCLGLIPALELHFRRFSSQTGVQVRFQKPEWSRRLAPQQETALFRIAQEALTNVARHDTRAGKSFSRSRTRAAASTRIKRKPRGKPSAYPACGSGLPNSTARGETVGLSSMRERASQLDGACEIRSAPGRGTTVRVVLPARWQQ